MDDRFDLKIIPEFDGAGTVIDWNREAGIGFGLSEVKLLDRVISLRLTGGEFVVY